MRVGEIVEDFELPDQTGRPQRLSGLLRGGPVVLFFFPAALNPLCVREACHFRDMATEFAAVGAQPVGVSGSSVDRQRLFVERHALGYPMLSDVDGRVRAQFEVMREYAPDLAPAWAKNRRNTYIIAPDRRVLDIIRSNLRPAVHADMALDYFRQHTEAR